MAKPSIHRGVAQSTHSGIVASTGLGWLHHRPKTSDNPNHKISFSESSKSSTNSRPSSPAASQQRTSSSKRASSQQIWGDNRNFQRINRQSEALWQYVDLHAPLAPSTTNHLQDPLLCLQQPHSLNLFSYITTPSFPSLGPIRLFNS